MRETARPPTAGLAPATEYGAPALPRCPLSAVGFASAQRTLGALAMCRNIKILFNFNPPVTEEEIRAAALQFVRKVSGFNKPSKANEAAFAAAVEAIASVSKDFLDSLQTSAIPRNRAEEAARAQARAALRFSR
jgi:hypothetical protein